MPTPAAELDHEQLDRREPRARTAWYARRVYRLAGRSASTGVVPVALGEAAFELERRMQRRVDLSIFMLT